MRISTAYDKAFSALESGGVLQEIKPESLCKHIVKTIGALQRVNLQVLSCCDGHQFRHITQHTMGCCDEAKRALGLADIPDDCFHWRTENGGPFMLSVPEIKTHRFLGKETDFEHAILTSMNQGMNLKKLDVVLLIGHADCGMVKDRFTSPSDYSINMVRAAHRCIEIFPHIERSRVITWLQVHRQDGRRMYSIDTEVAARQLAA